MAWMIWRRLAWVWLRIIYGLLYPGFLEPRGSTLGPQLLCWRTAQVPACWRWYSNGFTYLMSFWYQESKSEWISCQNHMIDTWFWVSNWSNSNIYNEFVVCSACIPLRRFNRQSWRLDGHDEFRAMKTSPVSRWGDFPCLCLAGG